MPVFTAIADRELTGRADAFLVGTRRVYAWFAVSQPQRYRQQVFFRWFRDGREVGGPVTTTIEGGRTTGYCTAMSKTNPVPATGAPTCPTSWASSSAASPSTSGPSLPAGA